MTESPAAKAVIDAGRRKIADRVSPDPALVTLTPIDSETDGAAAGDDGEERSASRSPMFQVCDGSSGPVLTPMPPPGCSRRWGR